MKKLVAGLWVIVSFFGWGYADLQDWNITQACEPVTNLIQQHVRDNRENQYELEQIRTKFESNYEYCVENLEAWTKSRRDIYVRNYPSQEVEEWIEYVDERYFVEIDNELRCENYWSSFEDENWDTVYDVELPTELPLTWWGWWPNFQFSDTNNQKQNIQEADLIKSNGRNIYQVQWNKIAIYKVNAWWNVQENNTIWTIYLPDTQWKLSELLLVDTTLVVVNMPTVLLYDISNPLDPVLQRKISFRWTNLRERNPFVREVDGVLYLKWSYTIQTLDILEAFDAKEDIVLSPSDYLPVVDDLQLSYDRWNYSLQWTSYPYEFNRTQFDCPQMLMAPWSRWDRYDLMFKVDLKDTGKEIETVGYMWNSTFHMWSESIYMIQNDGHSNDWLISKIPYNQGIFSFAYHQEFDGKPIGTRWSDKYSMDENDKWEFRMFVSKWRNQWTDVLTFDQTLEPMWSILGIQPDESFQWGLFIWDKGYLVTFRQTDPLFVIDLADSSNPEVIWELKIPGFSEYLHPYAPMQWWVQYLLWLGYDAEEEFGRRTWLKLDLYKVDYNSKKLIEVRAQDNDWVSGAELWASEEWRIQYCQKFYTNTSQVENIWDENITGRCERNNRNCIYTSTKPVYQCLNNEWEEIGKVAFWQWKVNMHLDKQNQISVTQAHSKVREGSDTISSVLQNPKNFVWDSQEKILLLPLESGLYFRSDETKFNWFKMLSVTPWWGIQERFSKNLVDWWFVDKFQGWFYVWYVWNTLYGLHKEFAHFIDTTTFEEKHITTTYVWDVANDPEFQEALAWMYSNWLTKYNGIAAYRPHEDVTNEQSTKFFVQLYQTLYPDREHSPSVLEGGFRTGNDQNMDYSLEPYAKILLYDLKYEHGLFYNRQQWISREQISFVLARMLDLVAEDDPKNNSFQYNCSILQKNNLIKVCDSRLWITRYHMALLLFRAYISTLDEDATKEFQKHQDWRRLGVEVY